MSFTKIGLLFFLAASIVACASTKEVSTIDDAMSQMPVVETTKLTSIQVEKNEVKTAVELSGSARLDYNVFRLTDPQRVIVDLANCEIDSIESLQELNDGLITVITANQYNNSKNDNEPVTRVMIAFEREAEFVVSEENKTVILDFIHPQDMISANKKEDSPVVAEEVPEPVAEQVEETEETPVVMDVKPEPVCAGDEPVKIVSYDGKTSKASLTSLSISSNGEAIDLNMKVKGKIRNGSYEILRLCNPDRIVVDLYGVKKVIKSRAIAGDGNVVEKVRFGKHASKLRMVLDLNQPVSEVALNTIKNGAVLALGKQTPVVAPVAIVEPVVEEVKEAPVAEPVKEVAVAENKEEKATVNTSAKVVGLDFSHGPTSSTISLALQGSSDYKLIKNGEDQVVLELPNTTLTPALEQSLDTSEFDGPVTLISSYVADSEKKLVKVVAQTRYDSNSNVILEGNTLKWQFDRKGAQVALANNKGHIKLQSDGQTVIEYDPGETASMQTDLTGLKNSGVAQSNSQRISLELKNTDILDVLRLIADVSKLNIIASDDVVGTVTVRLLNVPWQQALDIILRSKGLGKERKGNIIRVAPLDVLQTEQEYRLSQARARQELEPLHVRLMPISYSLAENLVEKVSDLLSARGTVNYDERTNVVIVKDIDEVLAKAESLVSKLDLQTPQVMIESKIVEADITQSVSYGIQWGGHFSMSGQTGNSTGVAFPNSVELSGAQGADNNYLVNLPVAQAAGGIGLVLGNATDTAQLMFRISAMEIAGDIRILSAPKVSTLDNKEATIMQGLEVPVVSVSVYGIPVTKMVKANMELKVTPHITADGSIIMKLDVQKKEPDFSRTDIYGNPAIITKAAQTEVLVRTGETTVIGGIYTKKTVDSKLGIPYLSKIPVLGYLFKSKNHSVSRTELLIFVTPRIINRSQSSLATD